MHPVDEDDLMIVGQISLQASNQRESFLNGTHRSGLNVIIQNSLSRAEYQVFASNSGTFILSGVPEAEYTIIRVNARIPDQDDWQILSFNPSIQFKVEAGKVNNIGVIAWFSDPVYSVQTLGNHAEVRDIFARFYTDSSWNQREWNDIVFDFSE
jgi:hypothetical protein